MVATKSPGTDVEARTGGKLSHRASTLEELSFSAAEVRSYGGGCCGRVVGFVMECSTVATACALVPGTL